MSQANAELVEKFLLTAHLCSFAGWSTSWFHEDICYELSIDRANPLRTSFKGRETVEEYLAVIRADYQILEPGIRTIVSYDNEVIVHGSELARLTLSGQLVRAQWVASIALEASLIKKISMTVYRWTVLSASSQVVIKSYLVPDRKTLSAGLEN